MKNPQFSVHNLGYNAKLYLELLNLRTGCAIRSPSIPQLSWPSSVPPENCPRPRLHWSQNRHNTAVWTDSRQGSRYQHITVYVSGYTETDTTGMLSSNNGRLSGANKVGEFRVDSLAKTAFEQDQDGTPSCSCSKAFYKSV